MILTSLTRFRDFGLLLLRLGLGGFFFWVHGLPKILGGVPMWRQIGGSMRYLGIDFMPEIWGFLATFAESAGALLFAIGFLFRPASFLLAVTMTVASITMWYTQGGKLAAASQPIELAIIFFCMLLIGPGKYSVDRN